MHSSFYVILEDTIYRKPYVKTLCALCAYAVQQI